MDKRDEKSITVLLSDLTREITTLFKQEVRLVKIEMSEKIDQAESGVVWMIVGGALAYAGLLILLYAVVLGFSEVMAAWLSALIVAGVVMAIGLGIVGKGKAYLRARNLMPQKTVESLQRDKQVAQEHRG
ncbi:MAG: phage holin family protein [Desulfobulbaceae bacterium]|nr:phage holin family protein [Desulfobulbaceae bacterium]